MKKLLLLLFLISTVGVLFAGTMHAVYVELYDAGGNHPDSATFQAWIVGRESEVLTETSTGCTYYDSGTYKGIAQIQCGTFPTQWQEGDVLHVEATTSLGDGTGEFTLTTDNFQGFGPIFGNTGIQVQSSGPEHVTIPNGEEGAGDDVVPTTDTGTYVSDGYGRTDLQNDGYTDFSTLTFPDHIGIYTIVTLDDSAPVTITVTLSGISYDPYDFAYYTNNIWHLVPHGSVTWNNHAVTFTINFAKGAKGNVNVPIVFANGSGQGNTLPVVLAQYYVKQLAEFAQITWTTQSETNMIGYRVWRSTVNSLDKANVVSSLINATNETAGHTYRYTDQNVTPNNTYYYWLEAQNYDGNSHYYQLGDVTIEPNQTPNLPQVTNLTAAYPNPFNPETTIKFSVKEGETATLTIYNLKNQVVLRKTFQPGEHNYTFDGTKLASGIYFYRLQSPSYTNIKKMTMIK